MSNTMQLRPDDQYNRELTGNVHPPDWVNPEPAGKYNLVVIGAGTAGLVTAAGAAGLGAKVALVERSLMGGDCLNVGCVPSKALIRSSRVVADMLEGRAFGVNSPDKADVDFPAVMERVRRIRAQISRHDSVHRFSHELGVDVFLGEAKFTGDQTVEVGDKVLRFQKAVIATGAHAVHPPIDGLAEAGFLTNENVFNLTERPEHLAVIGGGPIGSELAQAFRRLGSRVTIIDREEKFLPREDPDAALILEESFKREGIDVIKGAGVKGVRRENGEKVILVQKGENEIEVAADEILVGVGRAPNVDGLNLEAVGVEYDKRRGVIVDDNLRTSNKRIYAAGDVCLEYKFTHTADAAARIVIQNALFFGRKKLSALTIPWTTYTDPEIAHVGLNKSMAAKAGVEIDTFTRELKDVDRAIADGEERGFVKIHVKKGSDQILGATIVARHAGEMLSEITLAMVNKVGLGKLGAVIHPYPTQAEAIKQAADAYNRTRLTPMVKAFFARWLAWARM
jgi:mercury(II) reductase